MARDKRTLFAYSRNNQLKFLPCYCSMPARDKIRLRVVMPKVLVTFVVVLLCTQEFVRGSHASPASPPLGSDEDSSSSSSSERDDHTYGVVIDAGSSGSRVRIYSWPPRTDRLSLPKFEEIHSRKVAPGISDFGNDIDGLKDYIAPLLEEAKKTVPVDKRPGTSLYLMATAGQYILAIHQSIQYIPNPALLSFPWL